MSELLWGNSSGGTDAGNTIVELNAININYTLERVTSYTLVNCNDSAPKNITISAIGWLTGDRIIIRNAAANSDNRVNSTLGIIGVDGIEDAVNSITGQGQFELQMFADGKFRWINSSGFATDVTNRAKAYEMVDMLTPINSMVAIPLASETVIIVPDNANKIITIGGEWLAGDRLTVRTSINDPNVSITGAVFTPMDSGDDGTITILAKGSVEMEVQPDGKFRVINVY